MHSSIDIRHIVLLLSLRKDLDLDPGLDLLTLDYAKDTRLTLEVRHDLRLRVLRLILLLLGDEVWIVRLKGARLKELTPRQDPLKVVTEGVDVARGCLID